MIRPLIYALSRSRLAGHVAANVPGFRGFSRRFVAGETQQDVIDAVRRLNAQGFDATVSFLGEEVTDERAVEAAIRECTSYAAAVKDQALRSHISIKLSELGLAFDRDLAARSLHDVLDAAQAAGTFVRIDMEDARYTDATLSLFRDIRATHENVGVVIQASLRRSERDVARLAAEGAPVRLVKGAYREPEHVAYQDKRDVDEAFVRLAALYFERMAPEGWLAVATHDARMIRAAIAAAQATFWRRRPSDASYETLPRSEERRVGKECRSRWSPYH